MPNNILVIGDLIIDETYHVEVNRISPEAPIPTAELLQANPEQAAGGAGFAAAFARKQAHNAFLCTSATIDNASMMWFKHQVRIIQIHGTRHNVTKTRFIDKQSGYHILRLDNDRIVKSSRVMPSEVIQAIKGNRVDGCILSDYKKGFFNPSFRWHELIDYLAGQKIPTLLDTRIENIRHFMIDGSLNPELWLKLNKMEAEKVRFNLLGPDIAWEDRNGRINRLIITKGSEGASVYDDSAHHHITVPPELIDKGTPDTTGCGDIFDVSFIEGLLQNTSAMEAAEYAVRTASEYAWIPFKDKLCSQPTID